VIINEPNLVKRAEVIWEGTTRAFFRENAIIRWCRLWISFLRRKSCCFFGHKLELRPDSREKAHLENSVIWKQSLDFIGRIDGAIVRKFSLKWKMFDLTFKFSFNFTYNYGKLPLFYLLFEVASRQHSPIFKLTMDLSGFSSKPTPLVAQSISSP